MDRSVIADVPREKYVERCKQRAFDYLDRGDLKSAVSSFVNSMDARPDCVGSTIFRKHFGLARLKCGKEQTLSKTGDHNQSKDEAGRLIVSRQGRAGLGMVLGFDTRYRLPFDRSALRSTGQACPLRHEQFGGISIWSPRKTMGGEGDMFNLKSSDAVCSGSGNAFVLMHKLARFFWRTPIVRR